MRAARRIKTADEVTALRGSLRVAEKSLATAVGALRAGTTEEELTGILLEAEAVPAGLAVVVGIGTNVIAAPEGTPTPATSLHALGIQIGAEELFHALSDAWVEFRGIWNGGRGFSAFIRRRKPGRFANSAPEMPSST